MNGLTETEHRVAALVTKGHTNREVAAAMFVTQNTVQTHVRHIFQKLSVRSRTELTALLLTAPASPTIETGPALPPALPGPPGRRSRQPGPEYH